MGNNLWYNPLLKMEPSSTLGQAAQGSLKPLQLGLEIPKDGNPPAAWGHRAAQFTGHNASSLHLIQIYLGTTCSCCILSFLVHLWKESSFIFTYLNSPHPSEWFQSN